MQRLMPAARLEIIDHAAHLANFDRTRKFNELVSAFLMASGA
jgi:pimeloyl-ACP methyl ester carboxylesterase